jgi:glycosyltransferase involved in cell wall biosynthesis
MRILQVSSAREIGGGERHFADLSNGLARRGHAVFASLRAQSPLRAHLSEIAPRNILELPLRNALDLSSAIKLKHYARENQIEIIHAHVARDYPLAALATRGSAARLVLTRHVLFPLKTVHRLTLRRTAGVIAVSEAVADGLRGQAIFPPEIVRVIHNGINVDRFRRGREQISRASRDGRWRVGAVGQLAPIKGQEDLIRAAAKVCQTRDDVEFIITGEADSRAEDYRKHLEKLIHELGLESAVRLLGWADDVADLLPTFDLFVSASRYDAFGLSTIEAMAAGVPIISTTSAGAREIIEADRTGRLVPIGDVENLARAIFELLNDPSERARLAQNAQATVAERFSLNRMIERTEAVYREVLTG